MHAAMHILGNNSDPQVPLEHSIAVIKAVEVSVKKGLAAENIPSNNF
jgi:hypothetical protein